MCSDDTARIPLWAKGGSIRAYVTIDAADADFVNQWRWCLNEGYARRTEWRDSKRRNIYLHRLLLGLAPGDGMEGDHINRDRLDCRRENLRALTKTGNRQNHPSRGGTSPHRGVSWDAKAQKWFASIQSQGRTINLGLYASEAEAAAVARAARQALMPYSTD